MQLLFLQQDYSYNKIPLKAALDEVASSLVINPHQYVQGCRELYDWLHYLPVRSRINTPARARVDQTLGETAASRTGRVIVMSQVTLQLTLQHLVRPEETVSQLCDPAHIFSFITEIHYSVYGLLLIGHSVTCLTSFC